MKFDGPVFDASRGTRDRSASRESRESLESKITQNSLSHAIDALDGKFTGKGVNHEGVPFRGSFQAKSMGSDRGVMIEFHAVSEDGTPLHSESSLLGRNLQDSISIWVLSSNHPSIFERILIRSESLPGGAFVWVFGFGRREDRQSFREEIYLEVQPQKSVRYTYSWGLPGGDFAVRSGVLMHVTH